MKNRSHNFAHKLRKGLRSVVRESTDKHEKRLSGSDLLINSLTAFNFRRPLVLQLPGEQLARMSGFSQ